MKIHEYQAKEIFAKFSIPVPEGKVATTPEEAEQIAKELGGAVVIKAQVHVGGRGKAGGVKLAKNPGEAKEVLITKAIDIKDEAYIGFIVDRKSKSPLIMVSAAGGIDIEQVARETPEKIHKMTVDPEYGLFPHQAMELAFCLYDDIKLVRKAADVIEKLYTVFMSVDSSLTEINPFVVSKDGETWAVDAKINVDDNALSRHPDIESLREVTENEKKELDAKSKGLSYIKLDGNIGCVVNGAGLAMATMDLIKKYGGEPANFLDIGGSSSPEKVVNALNILISDKNVKSIFFNIFGGITRCDDVANGIVEALSKLTIDLPIVIRLAGTNEDRAKKILSETELITAASMSEGARKSIEIAGK
jgi:succinyl-CoA synthetase beta subunit